MRMAADVSSVAVFCRALRTGVSTSRRAASDPPSVASAHHWLGMDARGKSDVIGLVTHYGVIERLFGRRVHHGAVLRVACNLDGTVRSIEEVRSLT